MQTYRAELRRVADAPDLTTLQASSRGASPAIPPTPAGWGTCGARASRDLGALKRELLDLWLVERNRLAEAVVKEVRAQR